jgi:hypothetical protein
MRVRYTIQNVSFIPGAKTADVNVRARIADAEIGNHNFQVPVEVISDVNVLSTAVDALIAARFELPEDTKIETVLFSNRAGAGF